MKKIIISILLLILATRLDAGNSAAVGIGSGLAGYAIGRMSSGPRYVERQVIVDRPVQTTSSELRSLQRELDKAYNDLDDAEERLKEAEEETRKLSKKYRELKEERNELQSQVNRLKKGQSSEQKVVLDKKTDPTKQETTPKE